MHIARLFHAEEKYGVYRWIGNKILHHFDVLKFEIGQLEDKKIKFSNVFGITPYFFFRIVIIQDFIGKLLSESILDFGKCQK